MGFSLQVFDSKFDYLQIAGSFRNLQKTFQAAGQSELMLFSVFMALDYPHPTPPPNWGGAPYYWCFWAV